MQVRNPPGCVASGLNLGVMPGFPGVGGPIYLVALIFFIMMFPLSKEKPPMGGFSIASGI